MSELKRKYRVAPRHRSPDHLDSLILARAEHNIPARRRLVVSPWKTAVVFFCVAGFGIALLFRFGMPSLDSLSSAMPDSFDDAASVESKTIASLQKDTLVTQERNAEPVVNKRNAADIDRAETASTQFADASIPEVLSSAKGQVAELASADSLVLDKARSTSPEVALLSIESEPAAQSVPLELAQPVVKKATSVVSRNDTDVTVSAANIAKETESSSGATALGSTAIESDLGAPAVVARSSVQLSPLSGAKTLGANEADVGKRRMKSLLAGGQPEGKQVPGGSALVASQSESAAVDAAGWIARQSVLHFTLQLAIAPDADYLLAFGRSLNLNQALYVVDISDDQSRDSFGLFYGVFDTADQASREVNSLKNKVTELSPLVRNFNELRFGLEIP